MALLAYKDPQTSPMGYLMSTSQREAVADIIIAGILQSSGNADVKDANSSKVNLILVLFMSSILTPFSLVCTREALDSTVQSSS